MSQYGTIGWGGRQAVAWLGPGPDGEDTGDLTGPMDGVIDPVAGHGTFIAGLIRQLCPDADVLSVRIVRSDGLIVEGDLVATLGQVYELARRYAAGEPGGYPIDVVSMSMGVLPRAAARRRLRPDDAAGVAAPGRTGHRGRGVGRQRRDGRCSRPRSRPTRRARPRHPTPAVPIVGAGALNPDGTVALFSNGGPWVRHWEQGAARWRQSLDPDNFAQGFGVWSGTSFAAPVLAGKLAQALIAGSQAPGGVSLDAREPADALRRWWTALTHQLPWLRRP